MPARPTAATTRPAPRPGARADARARHGRVPVHSVRRAPAGAGAAAGRLASRGVVLAVLAVLLGLAVVASLALGARHVPLGEVLTWARGDGASLGPTVAAVLDARLTRTVVALAAGAALAASGAAMQGITRNPLADPGLLGVNAGATTAVVLATGLLGLVTPTAYLVSALLGAAVAFVFVWTVASLSPTGASPLTLVLAGAATAAGLSAVANAVSLVKVNDLESTRRWQTGIVSGRTWDLIVPAVVVMAVGLLLVLSQARVLDALAMGEDVATGLGVPVVRGRAVASLGAVALCAGATALAGPIGFVGIMAPHLMRLLGGPSHAWTVTAGALGGGLLVVVADVVGRVVAPPAELPAGVLVALLGVPVLIVLVRVKGLVRL